MGIGNGADVLNRAFTTNSRGLSILLRAKLIKATVENSYNFYDGRC